MEIKPANAYGHLKVSYIILYYIINIVTLLHVHVLATLVAILREVSYKGQFTFCNISFVLHLTEDGHKSGQNMYMQEGYCIYNIV